MARCTVKYKTKCMGHSIRSKNYGRICEEQKMEKLAFFFAWNVNLSLEESGIEAERRKPIEMVGERGNKVLSWIIVVAIVDCVSTRWIYPEWRREKPLRRISSTFTHFRRVELFSEAIGLFRLKKSRQFLENLEKNFFFYPKTYWNCGKIKYVAAFCWFMSI